MKAPESASFTATELRCPACAMGLTAGDGEFRCDKCDVDYPVVAGIPILIADERSVFSCDDFVANADALPNKKGVLSSAVHWVLRHQPGLSLNPKSESNYARFANELESHGKSPRVLVVGGSIVGQGMESLLQRPSLSFVETDVVVGPRTQIVCDGHDLPFADDTFDGVIVQAVLEHVLDPFRCVAEIKRVLKPDGIVYAEIPFMQQVHGNRYDFHRFSHLALLRLFREFKEIDSGAAGGPGMALAWSYRYFLLSFLRSARGRLLASLFAHFTGFWLKYFDYFLIDKPGSLDASSGNYFLGQSSDEILDDRVLLASYRGGDV
jgi:SAM-dependent methyltransferase/uncharacterized protein YbaR (Trm112 family)